MLPVSTESAVDAVVAQLKRLVLSGELTPGEFLPSEQELASELAVSRPTLREALRIMIAMGLLVRSEHPRRGRLVVVPLDERTLRVPLADLIYHRHITHAEVSAVLAITEPSIAAAAASAGSSTQFADIHAAIENLDAAEDELSIRRAHSAFHDSVAAASQNGLLAIIWRTLDVATSEMVDKLLTEPKAVGRMKKLHRDLAFAITARDADRAIALAGKHSDAFTSAYRDMGN